MNQEDQKITKSDNELQEVAEFVKSLPEDTVSLAWRSELNEKLLSAAPIVRKRVWLPRFAMATSLACGIALGIFIAGPERSAPSANPLELEASLVRTHLEATQSREISGVGLTAAETARSSFKVDSETSWSEVDLSTL